MMLRALPPPDPSGQGNILSEPCIPAPYGRRSGIEISMAHALSSGAVSGRLSLA